MLTGIATEEEEAYRPIRPTYVGTDIRPVRRPSLIATAETTSRTAWRVLPRREPLRRGMLGTPTRPFERDPMVIDDIRKIVEGMLGR